MGLAKPFPGMPASLPTAAFEQARVDRHLFALCFGHDGGHFSIGGFNSTLFLEKLDFVKYSGETLYELHLSVMVIWDQIVEVNQPAGIDSFMKLTQIPKHLF